jgi:hypothetical protein
VGAKFSSLVLTGPGAQPASYKMVSYPGVKQPGRGLNHPPPFSAQVKERVELYIYFPSEAFMVSPRVNFTFTFTFIDKHLKRLNKQNEILYINVKNVRKIEAFILVTILILGR